MKQIKLFTLLAIGFIFTVSVNGKSADTIEQLKKGWQEPAATYKQHTRWWWPGNAVTKEGISYQLEQMHEKGIGGVEIMSFISVYEKGNIDYLSDEFLEMLKYAVSEAKRLGMEVSITFGPGWLFGGYWVEPKDRIKALEFTVTDVDGGNKYEGWLSRDWGKGELEAVIAGRLVGENKIEFESLTDLTDKVREDSKAKPAVSDDGQADWISWDVPEGKWRIMNFRLKDTGQIASHQNFEPTNWVVDHLNKGAMQRYCNYLGGKFYEAFGDEFGKTVDSMFSDSFEHAAYYPKLLWGTGVTNGFKKYSGYDMKLYLPGLIYDIGDVTPRLRYDVHKYLNDLSMETMFGVFNGWCEKHNVKAKIQPYGSFVSEIIEGACNSGRPETEFCSTSFATIAYGRKSIASGARFSGDKILSAESYTFLNRERYRSNMREIKIATDNYLRDGVTQIYNHGYFYSPEKYVTPTRDIPWANLINHQNLWWQYYGKLTPYVARSCYMLRQGKFAADVLIYSPVATDYSRNRVEPGKGMNQNYGDMPHFLLSNGYDYDLVNDQVLWSLAKVKDGQIVINGMDYKILIMPDCEYVPLKTMKFIESFVKDGGVVIALENMPAFSCGMKNYKKDDESVGQIAAEIFAEKDKGYFIKDYKINTDQGDNYQKAKQEFINIVKQHVTAAMAIDGVRASDGVTFIQRKIDDVDVFFVTNQQPSGYKGGLTFNVSGKKPMLWDAIDGSIEDFYCYRDNGKTTTVDVDLQGWESMFVVFHPQQETIHLVKSGLKRINNLNEHELTGFADAAGEAEVIIKNGDNYLTITKQVDIPALFEVKSKWNIVLEGYRFDRLEKSTDKLFDLSSDETTKWFSGMAVYETEFELAADYLNPDLQVYLDLGTVGCVAEVFVNGKNAGVAWMSPYKVNITGMLSEGKNKLKVLVTNTWNNFVKGPRYEKPMEISEELWEHYGKAPRDVFNNEMYPWDQQELKMIDKNLPVSGLIGPVKVIPEKQIKLNF
ncbi:MAG TPA: glycosyl hydrolase [Sedimentisphaerales bacterium]|nr:glycosyl hydrolase [Sedimentisphaerales bacterium]